MQGIHSRRVRGLGPVRTFIFAATVSLAAWVGVAGRAGASDVPPSLEIVGQFKVDDNGVEKGEILGGYDTVTDPADYKARMTSENVVRFKARLKGPSSASYRLEVEVRKLDAEFDDGVSETSSFVAVSGAVHPSEEGTEAYADFQVPLTLTATTPDTAHGPYKWRARAIDADGNSVTGDWEEFEGAGHVDFMRAIRVAIVLTYFQDVPPLTPAAFSPPCHKIGAGKSYAAEDNSPNYLSYLEDVGACLNSYYAENSYGGVQFDFVYFPSTASSDWLSPNQNPSFYNLNDTSAEALATLAVNFIPQAQRNDFPIVVSACNCLTNGSEGLAGDKLRAFAFPMGPQPQGVIAIPLVQTFGTWAHEFGHSLGVVLRADHEQPPDLYSEAGRGLDNNVGYWDLMAWGEVAGSRKRPPNMSAYTKDLLGLISPTIDGLPSMPSATLVALPQATRFDAALKYYPEENWQATSPHYIVEARNSSISYSEWDTTTGSVSYGNAVVYYVQDGHVQIPGLGSDIVPGTVNDGVLNPNVIGGEKYLDMHHLIAIRASNGRDENGKYKLDVAVTSPSVANVIGAVLLGRADSQVAVQIQNIQSFIAKFSLPKEGAGTRLAMEKGEATSSKAIIEPDWYVVSNAPFTPIGKVVGIIAICTGLIVVHLLLLLLTWMLRRRRARAGTETVLARRWWAYVRIAPSLLLTVAMAAALIAFSYRASGNPRYDAGPGENALWPLKSVRFSAEENSTGLDKDLHVYCADGRHVGVNYATGVYEVQIQGVITNGDNIDAPEWIFFPPEGNEGCHYSVSSHDNAAFLAANPEIASQLTDTTDTYDLYARTIDPETGVHTSELLSGQTIAPGVGTLYTIGTDGEGNPTAVEGVTDGAAPSLAVDSPADGATVPSATLTLAGTASDEQDGSGLNSVRVGDQLCRVAVGTWTCVNVALEVGENSLSVVATDNAGNQSAVQVKVVRHLDTQ